MLSVLNSGADLDQDVADPPHRFRTLALRGTGDHTQSTRRKQHVMRNRPGGGGGLANLTRGQSNNRGAPRRAQKLLLPRRGFNTENVSDPLAGSI